MSGASAVAGFRLAFGQLCRDGDVDRLSAAQRDALDAQVGACVTRGQPIRLTLPGFPLKSPDRRGRVLGMLPDRGEQLALGYLDAFCETVRRFYAPGCVVDLFSDGLTFFDLLDVRRADANAYHRALRELVVSRNIVWHSYSTVDPSFDRDASDVDAALAPYWPADDDKRCDARGERVAELTALLAGERRIVLADADTATRARLSRAAQRMAERGVALDGFLDAKLPAGLRLTVHAAPHGSKKIPIRLHAGGGDGALPWRNVLLQTKNGEFAMLSKSQVDQTVNAALVTKGGEPWYFAEGDDPVLNRCAISVVHRDDFGLLVEPNADEAGRIDCCALSKDALATMLRRHGFVVLRGFRVDDEAALVKFTEQFGKLYVWKFGPVHKVKPEEDANGYVHSFEAVPLHWDLSMLPLTHPLVQQDEYFSAKMFALYCKTAPKRGEGMTTLVDARRIVSQLDAGTLAAWERTSLTYDTKMTYFGGVPRTFPLIATHPDTGEKVLRYQEGSESTLQRFEVSIATPGTVPDDSVQQINALAYAREYLVEHDWVDGDIVLVDNYSVLHGRRAMSRESAARELWRVQVY
ncbi:L-tyrosine/L-tryptophan isonitrile synthase family protein [Burkholderia pyrrocinia]|uniref:L-tyrosine/L-tryptophan isonitrile synthase family protein n=1 Tax=Burkholderia pyrrocinia TaxID=60550 RepID=UPI00158EC0D3|nr:L-tyrosine/L-tryptophan isonitrile synthase family protein [Burkholderia pyrrocinia]